MRHLFNINPAFGPKDIFVFSKIATTELLDEIGIRQPEHHCLERDSDDRDAERLEALLKTHGWLVAKPEFGARSRGILIIRNSGQLIEFLRSDRDRRYLVQAFVSGDELSIFFDRLPGQDIRVRSILRRSKITIVGDGRSTLQQLASSVCEGKVLSAVLQFHDGEEIIPEGHERLLSVLGTYRLGASYERVSEQPPWVSDVETGLSGVDGLNYCRLDVICNPENREYWVLELNGSHAEPLEAYQEPFDSSRFYDVLAQSILRRVEIGKAVEDRGGHSPTWIEILGFAKEWCVDSMRRSAR